MFRFIGCADIPGVCLKYYVFGNRRKGYGIKILRSDNDYTDQYVSRNLLRVLDLASQFCRCKVFPENLCEIIDDLKYDSRSD
ncbi:hypothetical protein CAFE_02520 [Caprobacter fermentans]|uniref:Uncharacterized protein n=1 Tax=Caproicibacter fermentans TaxID=2576756 RepID=A0A6N8HVG6_9FIRM|nr:DUF6514 family protein [Caproicibacter fermentans]MVB09595.1 hypothetical protein [Caproicibacter fermentans]OCN01832.1 hypothetical protein A7X67_03415 [Clostridium sp. W14A]QNK40070.1 hypothetical protein HCR03_15410 [Caproicibacter fermentans]